MKERTLKLRNHAKSELTDITMLLYSEGMKPWEISRVVRNHLDAKVRNFYSDERYRFPKTREPFEEALKKYGVESKAEYVFYQMIKEEFEIKMQYKIGPYRADFLINDFLVVEIDGPHHDKDRDEKRDNYIRSMGYKILRVPIWLMSTIPGAVIDEIKDISNREGEP